MLALMTALMIFMVPFTVQAASFSTKAPVLTAKKNGINATIHWSKQSVVLLHSSPPGVQLAGTPGRTGKTESKAVKLATSYMKKYYPGWYKKYPNCAKGSQYLTQYAQMRWNITGAAIMTDPDGYRNMSADKILKDLFASKEK